MQSRYIRILMVCVVAVLSVAMPALSVADDTRQRAFSPDIRTIKVSPESNEYLPPIIVLGSDDRIIISFDELAEDHRYLRYSIVHCNADWQPSALIESEYIDGFNYADIEDYEYSSSTFTHYVHYRIALPNDQLRITRSGNYLLKVYPDDDPDATLLQARFMVCERSVDLYASTTTRTDVDYNRHMQQLQAKVEYTPGKINDPYNDLKLVVTQNGRPDTEVVVEHPMMVSANTVTYDHIRPLIFAAGNEYRRIETVSIHYPSMGVEEMKYFYPYYHAMLRIDSSRAGEPYYYDQTQHGHFTIREADSESSHTQADYVVTHFTLDAGGPLSGGRLYIDGEFTGHIYDSHSLMKYDIATGLYHCDLLLKQGAYNYQYLWVPDGQAKGVTVKVEGDHYQTVNEYLVRLYKRSPTDRADAFIGFALTFSGK